MVNGVTVKRYTIKRYTINRYTINHSLLLIMQRAMEGKSCKVIYRIPTVYTTAPVRVQQTNPARSTLGRSAQRRRHKA